LCGGLTLSSPPRRLGQIRFLKANAPDFHGFVPPCGKLGLLPHVGDVEVTKDCIWMRRLARVKGMVFSFKGLDMKKPSKQRPQSLPAITATRALL
jgi:hypothetical protein